MNGKTVHHCWSVDQSSHLESADLVPISWAKVGAMRDTRRHAKCCCFVPGGWNRLQVHWTSMFMWYLAKIVLLFNQRMIVGRINQHNQFEQRLTIVQLLHVESTQINQSGFRYPLVNEHGLLENDRYWHGQFINDSNFSGMGLQEEHQGAVQAPSWVIKCPHWTSPNH